jgi:hypothetical protein
MDEEGDSRAGKIYCANCINCKVIPSRALGEDVRIRCAAGKWKKKLGEEKFYRYNTVARRTMDECDAYDAMGDLEEFLKELKKITVLRVDADMDADADGQPADEEG